MKTGERGMMREAAAILRMRTWGHPLNAYESGQLDGQMLALALKLRAYTHPPTSEWDGRVADEQAAQNKRDAERYRRAKLMFVADDGAPWDDLLCAEPAQWDSIIDNAAPENASRAALEAVVRTLIPVITSIMAR